MKIFPVNLLINLQCFCHQLLLYPLYPYIPFGEYRICAELKTLRNMAVDSKIPNAPVVFELYASDRYD